MPLLTVDQAAERLGTSPRFIRRLVAERRIAFAKLGKHVRIDSADLDAFVAAGRVAPAMPPSLPESRNSTILRETSAAQSRRPVLTPQVEAPDEKMIVGYTWATRRSTRARSGPRGLPAGSCRASRRGQNPLSNKGFSWSG